VAGRPRPRPELPLARARARLDVADLMARKTRREELEAAARYTAWTERYLAEVAEHGDIARAVAAAGITWDELFRAIDTDAAFVARLDDAAPQDNGDDSIDDEDEEADAGAERAAEEEAAEERGRRSLARVVASVHAAPAERTARDFVDIIRIDENGRRVAYGADGKPIGHNGAAGQERPPVPVASVPRLDEQMAALAQRAGASRLGDRF
jgi:hypothetical protein